MSEISVATYSLAGNVAWRSIDGRIFAVTQDGVLHVIETQSGVRLFEKVAAGVVPLSELVAMLTDEFDISHETAEADTLEFLENGLAAAIFTLHRK